MKSLSVLSLLALAACAALPTATGEAPTVVDHDGATVTLQAGHPSVAKWRLPAQMAAPADNATTPKRVELGQKLFFDARLSVHGRTSCASCHMPERGWSDGVPRSIRFMGEPTQRNSQTIVNAGFHLLYNWDGKNRSLEHQATGSQSLTGSMSGGAKQVGISDANLGIARIGKIPGYVDLFAQAYPGEPINQATAAKAIAAFERTLISRNTPFDRWLAGDASAMSTQQVNGLRVFIDPAKGNCAICHSAPHFTDNGFHNIGLRQFAAAGADEGRYRERKVAVLKGAFKTPQLREVDATAPYFHDGSANTLMDVVEHYARGGDTKTNLSPNIKPLTLSTEEKADLVAFMRALSSPPTVYDYPRLPR